MPTPSTEPVASPPASRYRRARRHVYELLMSPEVETSLEKLVRGFITILILANVLMVILETVPEINARLARLFFYGEVVSVALFSVEYLLRLWAAVEEPGFARPVLGRLRFVVTFFALIDLLAILPFFLPHLVAVDMRFMRGLRLIRLSRMFKLGRFSRSLTMYSRILHDKREELLVSLGFLCLLLLMASSLMYFLEHEAQPKQFSNIPASMWWGIITLTTIGYGDVYPITIWGRVVGGFIAVIGIGFVALPSAILVGGVMEWMDQKKKAGRDPCDEEARPARPCPHCGRLPDEPRTWAGEG